MALSSQRVDELLEEYAKLKKTIGEIDHKYSLDADEVHLDFPPSLGLEKLTFTPKTDNEIALLVDSQVESKCVTRILSAQKNYTNARAALLAQEMSADEAYRQKTTQIADEYAANCVAAQHKAVNANLYYSSIFDEALADLSRAHNAALDEQTTRYKAQKAVFDEKAANNLKVYEQQMSNIDAMRKQLRVVVEKSIRDKDAKEALAVQKYNNSVDEKETKYKYSCERALEMAQRAENNRALAAARIYAQIGETGMALRIKTEKYNACINKFAQFTLDEARFVLNLDNFLQIELRDYYSALVDWVERVLTNPK